LEPRIILLDIENSPITVWTWGLFEENAIDTKENWFLLSYAWKELGAKKTHVVALPAFPGYQKDKSNDKELAKSLRSVLEGADIVIMHNGDRFDQRKANARFIAHKLPPPTPYKTIDTLKIARKHFAFDSNKLDNLGRYLGCGRKLPHTGKR